LSFILFFIFCELHAQETEWQKLFQDPPMQFRPVPFWHLNGKLTSEEIDRQMKDVRYSSGFGGVTVLPVSTQGGFSPGRQFPGTDPLYLTEEYFGFYSRILQDASASGMQVIWYDDLDFPSGSAGGRFKKMYPADTRKVLFKNELTISGALTHTFPVPEGTLMAVVAMNTKTRERSNLSDNILDGKITWNTPAGEWKVMIFTCDVIPGDASNDITVDYLDPKAIDKYLQLNNEQFAARYKDQLGSTIKQVFFDDVGFYTGRKHGERTWTATFNEKFIELYHTDPALYYPALWEDIGPDTEAARVALFNTRAELLAEGFPKSVTDWCDKYGLKSSGHPPGNYEPQPVDMNADIYKYYRHQHIPLMDLILYYGHGRDGYKLISSAANVYDKPVVAAEIYGAMTMFNKNEMDRNMLYRAAMEVFSRGINFLIPHGMWYNPDSAAVRIPPLISAYNPVLGPELLSYNLWAARCSLLLQGGQTVSDIAVIYPIASLEGGFHFDSGKSWGKFVPPGTDYLSISDMLTNQVHRDFTFIHPETLSSDQCTVTGDRLILNNKTNKQVYDVLIIPGGRVISVTALNKIKSFYESGGKVIATTLLPSKSAEFGMDQKVIDLVKSLFGIDPRKPMPRGIQDIKSNAQGGKITFIPDPDAGVLSAVLSKINIIPDISFENNPQPSSGKGMLSYIHKTRDGKDIYYFANSSDDEVNTMVEARGNFRPEYRDPLNGNLTISKKVEYIEKAGQVYTRFPLKLGPVYSIFVIGNREN
jgi:hypothetical protein